MYLSQYFNQKYVWCSDLVLFEKNYSIDLELFNRTHKTNVPSYGGAHALKAHTVTHTLKLHLTGTNRRGSLNHDIFSATHTLRFQY